MKLLKKNVALITPYYSPAPLSGSVRFNKFIAEMLSKTGFKVTVITSNSYQVRHWQDLIRRKFLPAGETTINGVKIIRLKHNQLVSFIYFILSKYLNFIFPKKINEFIEILPIGPLINAAELFQILKMNKFDYIYSSTLPFFLNIQLTKALSQLKTKPFFIFRPEFHSAQKVYHNSNLAFVLKRSDLIQVNTRIEKHLLIDEFHLNKNKFKTLPVAITSRNLKVSQKEINLFKKNYNLFNKKIVLFVGMRNYNKGAIFLLKTIRDLYKEDQAYLMLSLGLSEKEWFLAKLTGERRCVIDLGYTSDKQKQIAYKACNVFCLPSVSDSLGTVYLEAWLEKKPVIGAKIPAIQELIEGNKGGKCVEFNNIVELKKTLKLILNNQKLAQNYGNHGYNLVKKTFDQEKIKDDYLKLFL